MAGRGRGSIRARLAPVLRPFPILHALNAATALVYTLAQTLVLARALDRAAFSQAIAVTAVGFYLLPVSQIVAGTLGPALIVRADPPALAVGMVAYGLFNSLSNLWYFELQSALLAIDRPVAFEVASLVRRIANFVALAWLLISRDFLAFGLAMLVQAVLAQGLLMRYAAPFTDLFHFPRHLRQGAVAAHLGRLWTAVQATFGEWLTLNGPYGLFMFRFGVGAALVSLDTGMKLLRSILTVTRSLSEIGLPRISRSLLLGDVRPARRATVIVLGLSLLPAILLAGALIAWEQPIFQALLGPNSVIAAGAGRAFALAIIAGVGFQAGAHLVGYVGRPRHVALFMVAAVASFGIEAAYVLLSRPDAIHALWAVEIAFAATSAAGLAALAWTLGPKPPRDAASGAGPRAAAAPRP